MKYVLLLFLLSGCTIVPSFNPQEYHDLAVIKVNSVNLMPQCSNISRPDFQDIIITPIQIAKTEAEYRAANDNVVKSLALVEDIALNFYKSFNNNRKPSKIYCEEKLKNVSDGIDIILHTYGKL